MRVLRATFIALSLAGCKGTPPQPTPQLGTDAVIVLERTACYGTCPVYTLTVRGNGTVTFEGQQHTAVTGTRQGTVSAENLALLYDAIEHIRYFELDSTYDCNATDAPGVRTSVSARGTSKQVRRNTICEAPDGIEAFENLIDDVTNSSKWIE